MVAPVFQSSFGYPGNPTRVDFGTDGLSHLDADLDRRGATQGLLVATTGLEARIPRVSVVLGGRMARVFDRAAMQTPVCVTEVALAHAPLHEAEVLDLLVPIDAVFEAPSKSARLHRFVEQIGAAAAADELGLQQCDSPDGATENTVPGPFHVENAPWRSRFDFVLCPV